MAHGGIALLAVVFALALSAFHLATALARELVSALQQNTGDETGSSLSFTVGDTLVSYAEVLLYATTLALVALALFGTWLLTRRTTATCPECRSSVPLTASVCRFCTTELPDSTDA